MELEYKISMVWNTKKGGAGIISVATVNRRKDVMGFQNAIVVHS